MCSVPQVPLWGQNGDPGSELPGLSHRSTSIAPVVLSRMTCVDSRPPWGHRNSLYTLKAFSFLAAWD